MLRMIPDLSSHGVPWERTDPYNVENYRQLRVWEHSKEWLLMWALVSLGIVLKAICTHCSRVLQGILLLSGVNYCNTRSMRKVIMVAQNLVHTIAVWPVPRWSARSECKWDGWLDIDAQNINSTVYPYSNPLYLYILARLDCRNLGRGW